MAAINEITGKAIKTSPQNTKYAENWDKIFAKKSSHEWLKGCEDIVLYDPDGWRMNDGVDMNTPIKWADFQYRLSLSTIMCKNIK